MIVYSHYPWDPRVRKEAEALIRKGYSIDVICNKDGNQSESENVNGVNVHRIDFKIKRGSKLRYVYQYGKFYMVAKAKLKKLDKEKKFDIIHVHSLPSYLVFIAKKKKDRKIILDLHESFPHIFLARFPNKMIARFLSWIEKISANHANEIITVSETLKKIFIASGVKRNITVIMNVPDQDLTKINSTRSNDLKNKFIINYSGSLIKERGLDVAIQAVNEIKEDVPNICLMIFGSGGEEEKLKHMVNEMKLEKYVYFGGMISSEKVMQYTKIADIGIIPWYSNPITEVGSPNKLFECLALGKPVILAKTKGLYDAMGENAIFFEPGNYRDLGKKIVFAFKNKNKLNEMSLAGIKIYESISWKVMEKRLYDLYENI